MLMLKKYFNLKIILKVDWSYTWKEIDPPPVMVDKGVQISVKDTHRKRKIGELFGSTDSLKVFLIPDLQSKQVILFKV
jgi:hypothetical protein